VTPHVLMTFNHAPCLVGCSFVLKFCLLLSYVVWQIYFKKGYLVMGAIEGTSRLQLQHPVQACNPLSHGCKTNFRGFDELPYCKQHPGEVDRNAYQETCEYFDEFDIQTRGYLSDHMLIPTRETVYDQKVLCGGRDGPCSKKYEEVDQETVYVADIESFTLLIDHSMVCQELGLNLKSWDMVGFYEFCPELMEGLSSGCQLKPIQRANNHSHSKVGAQEEARAFDMWMEPQWVRTFFPFLGNSKENVDKVHSPFIKIENGDIIKVSHLLEEIGVNLDEHRNKSASRRHSGLVVVIDIEYTNFKSFSWPNHLPPVYKYKIKLSPADEYKVMATHPGHGNTSQRKVVDSHGIYIIINTTGYLGLCSWMYIGMMMIGALALEGCARYMVTMYALNFVAGDKRDGTTELENMSRTDDLETLIAKEVDVPSLATSRQSFTLVSQ